MRSNVLVAAALLGSISLVPQHRASAQTPAGAPQPVATRTVEEVAALLRAGSVHVFDNNSRAVYEAGHVPGARWVAFNQVSAESLPAERSAQLVFYCASELCSACHTAAAQAVALGYTHVATMPQGIHGWRASGQRVVVGPAPGN